MNFNRRAFLKTTAGTVASSWFLPPFYRSLLAAQGIQGPQQPGVTSNYPLAPLEAGIGSYRLPTGVFAAQQAQTLKYDWSFWEFKMGHPQPVDSVIGTLEIQRRPSSSGIEYQITQMRDARRTTAKVNCLADDFESVHDWTMEETYPVGGMEMPGIKGKKGGGGKGAGDNGVEKIEGKFNSSTTGLVDGANARVTRFGHENVVPLDGPLLCSWALMANPQTVRHLAASGGKFTLGEQMAMLRPGHLARPDRDVPVPTSTVSCATFLITGTGSPPTHMIIHPRIGSLFTTIYRSSTILTAIENAG